MAEFFNNELFSDCKIICSDGVEFKTHRVILCSNGYFKGLLTSNMIEANEKIINLPENSKILEEIIRFIYSGKVRPHSLDVKELLIAAHKYMVYEIADDCSKEIVADLEIENSIEKLLIAYTYYDVFDLDHFVKFIGENFENVKNSDGWKLIKEEKYSNLKDMLIDAFINEMNMQLKKHRIYSSITPEYSPTSPRYTPTSSISPRYNQSSPKYSPFQVLTFNP